LSEESAGLQTLYWGKERDATHLSPGLQWMSALQKHFIRELHTQHSMTRHSTSQHSSRSEHGCSLLLTLVDSACSAHTWHATTAACKWVQQGFWCRARPGRATYLLRTHYFIVNHKLLQRPCTHAVCASFLQESLTRSEGRGRNSPEPPSCRTGGA
jgi:hypothetical protein